VDREAPLDAERILQALAEHAVDYVIVGGLVPSISMTSPRSPSPTPTSCEHARDDRQPRPAAAGPTPPLSELTTHFE